MADKKFRVGAAILADYVGQGAANKITIVNAFSGDVILQELPTDVAFGFYLELLFDDPLPNGIDFEAVLNGNPLFKGATAAPPSRGANPATIILPFFQVKIEQDSVLEIFVSAEGYARTLALKKKIFKGPVPTS